LPERSGNVEVLRTEKFSNMLDKSKLPVIALTLLLLAGCGGNSEKEEGESDKAPERSKKEKKSSKEEEAHQGKSAMLKLNDGQKWKADSSTKAGVEAMQKIVDKHAPSDSLRAYQTLGDTLNGEFQRIFERCSMEGPGHDQLHNFLLPIKKDIQGLRSEELKQAKEAKRSLGKRLPKFDEYFE
jgi:hypothetical protein